jgi:hypothetical protein
MNGSGSYQEEFDLSNELQRLFDLQDRPLSEAKKMAYVKELLGAGFPYRAIIAGIRSLGDQDIKLLKLSTIISASKRYCEMEIPKGCIKCGWTGHVSMATEDKYYYAIPCVCERGTFYAKAQNLRQWNGQDIFFLSDGRKVVIWDVANGYREANTIVQQPDFTEPHNEQEVATVNWEE